MSKIQNTLCSAFGALLALLAGQARLKAETPSMHLTCLRTSAYTASVPLTPTNFNTTVTVPRFDPTRGTLISVQFNMNGTIQSHPQVESTDTRPTTISITRGSRISLRRPDNSELAAAIPALSLVFEASAYDGFTDFRGTSGKDFGVLVTSQNSASSVLTSAADLALFTGVTNISLPITGSASYLVTSIGNRVSRIATQAGAAIEVVYTYLACEKISGTVYHEAQLVDGVPQAGESGLTGVTITLTGDTDGDGDTETLSTTTDAGGNYSFDHLFPGEYALAEQLPAGYSISPNTPTLYHVAATTPNQTYSPYDFFLYTPIGSIGDVVWYDLNNNSVQDAGEPGLAGITLTLQDSLGNTLATTTTDSTGHYMFEHLVANDYRVCVATNTLPAGLIRPTFDFDGSNDSKANVVIGLNQTRLDGDFGYTGTGSIGGRVWNDRDGNGMQGDTETGMNGVTVGFVGSGPDGQFDTEDDITYAPQITGEEGSYLFINLPAGLYRVKAETRTLPPGYIQTFDADGIGTSNCAELNLGTEENKRSVDFGYRQPIAGKGTTRAAGYWKTRLRATQTAVGQHAIDLGYLQAGASPNGAQNLTYPTLGNIMAIFWASDTRQGSQNRTVLGKARMKLANHLMSAMANVSLLGTTTAQNGYSATLIVDARAALDGTNVNLINSFISQLDGFNNSGDNITFTSAQAQIAGSADPNGAKAAANRDNKGDINPGPAFR